MASTPQTTLLLDQSLWDLVLDTSGNIALASPPYSLAQDAASAIKLFMGEAYYDTTLGVPYWSQILGHAPNIGILKKSFVQAALTVPGVVAAVVYISSINDRVITGQVQVTDVNGVLSSASF